ncbi:soluble scavenger receptor cysteine-rich domain-containing protein SSC5D-like [Carcharodon carcharias]|uniref:soluble scavenger receptor cysteine-rich domain-containing protein SSC5D-like n=1 Tax=Carcharodon carcharias TaxID=13397 RepID=UPI001B7D95D8|nr:soluble scavenger receptor cysteine-rich domain-containing protein SSC5D-like [Carcharodon carcharias]
MFPGDDPPPALSLIHSPTPERKTNLCNADLRLQRSHTHGVHTPAVLTRSHNPAVTPHCVLTSQPPTHPHPQPPTHSVILPPSHTTLHLHSILTSLTHTQPYTVLTPTPAQYSHLPLTHNPTQFSLLHPHSILTSLPHTQFSYPYTRTVFSPPSHTQPYTVLTPTPAQYSHLPLTHNPTQFSLLHPHSILTSLPHTQFSYPYTRTVFSPPSHTQPYTVLTPTPAQYSHLPLTHNPTQFSLLHPHSILTSLSHTTLHKSHSYTRTVFSPPSLTHNFHTPTPAQYSHLPLTHDPTQFSLLHPHSILTSLPHTQFSYPYTRTVFSPPSHTQPYTQFSHLHSHNILTSLPHTHTPTYTQYSHLPPSHTHPYTLFSPTHSILTSLPLTHNPTHSSHPHSILTSLPLSHTPTYTVLTPGSDD